MSELEAKIRAAIESTYEAHALEAARESLEIDCTVEAVMPVVRAELDLLWALVRPLGWIIESSSPPFSDHRKRKWEQAMDEGNAALAALQASRTGTKKEEG